MDVRGGVRWLRAETGRELESAFRYLKFGDHSEQSAWCRRMNPLRLLLSGLVRLSSLGFSRTLVSAVSSLLRAADRDEVEIS